MENNMKEIFEKVKATASQAVGAAGKVADAAGKKAGEFVESTKANLKIFDITADIDGLFKEIGKCLYLTHTGVEIDHEEIEIKLALIDEKQKAIREIKAGMSDKVSSLRCPNCGKEYSRGDMFCSACGFEINS